MKLFKSGLSLWFSALVICLFVFSPPPKASAQVFSPWSTAGEQYAQFYNMGANSAGAYYLGNQSATAFVPGTQKDSTCSGCAFSPLYLAYGTFRYQAAPAKDTITPVTMYGTGQINMNIQAVLATAVTTTSAVVTVLPQQSNNLGYTWEAVPGTTSSVLTCTSSYGIQSASWSFAKNALWYRVKATATGDTAAVFTEGYFQKTQTVQIPVR